MSKMKELSMLVNEAKDMDVESFIVYIMANWRDEMKPPVDYLRTLHKVISGEYDYE